MINDGALIDITAVELLPVAGDWPFSVAERQKIDAHWAGMMLAKSALWNGQILMSFDIELSSNGVLRGKVRMSDFASFVAWRNWGWPDKTAFNLFGSAVIMAKDGALIYGKMGPQTANSGLVYPPGGSLEPCDMIANGVDVAASIRREMKEETGLDSHQAKLGRLLVVRDGQRLSVAQIFHFSENSDELADVVRQFLATERAPELVDVVVIKTVADLEDHPVPGYARILVGSMMT